MNRIDSIAEPNEPLRAPSKPFPNLAGPLLIQGFRIALRHWPFLVWAYAINLVFGLLAGIPFTSALGGFLDHSLAAQKIAGTIDLVYLAELAVHVHRTGLLPAAIHTGAWLNLLQLAILFVLFAGTVFAYVAQEAAQLSVLLRGGVAFFWRFVRAAVLAGGVAIVLLGVLLAARAALLAHAGTAYFERKLFVFAAVSGAVVLLAGLLLRLWWDLVEVHVVRNGIDGEDRVRYALLPALRLLFRSFFRTFGSFLLAGFSGLCGLALCLWVWNRLVPAHQVWLAALLAQLGLFLLLASRFWQRGIEAALVLAAYPLVEAPVSVEPHVEAEPVKSALAVPMLQPEPTLRDLVLKLQTDPLAAPDKLPMPPDLLAAAARSQEPFDKHSAKFPLGGVEPAKLPQNTDDDAAEGTKEEERPLDPGKKP